MPRAANAEAGVDVAAVVADVAMAGIGDRIEVRSDLQIEASIGLRIAALNSASHAR